MTAVMDKKDSIIIDCCSHGWTYMMNTSAISILAELMNKKTGCNEELGESMHQIFMGEVVL